MTAVEHVQRQIRTNRKPRTALLAEVFGRGKYCPVPRKRKLQCDKIVGASDDTNGGIKIRTQFFCNHNFLEKALVTNEGVPGKKP